MIELKCQNCGSSNLEYRNGIFVCPFCGSRFLAEKPEIPLSDEELKKREEKLVTRLMDLHHKKVRCKALDAPSAKLWLEYSEEIDLCVEEIFEINKKNVYALTLHMLQSIEKGLKTAEDAELIVSDVEQILQNITEAEKKDVIGAVRMNYDYYKEKLMELDPSLADRIRAIDELQF